MSVRVPRTARLWSRLRQSSVSTAPDVHRLGAPNPTLTRTLTCQHTAPDVHSLGAALDHDDTAVAHLPHADGEGEAAGPTTDYHHVRIRLLGRAHGARDVEILYNLQQPEEGITDNADVRDALCHCFLSGFGHRDTPSGGYS